MTRCLTSVCGVVLLTGWMATDARAQAAAANAHVEAARAAVAPQTENPLGPFHVFQSLFDQVCAEPTLPDVMRTQARSTDAVPRDEWFAWPADILDNLYFIGTQTAGVWAIDTSDGIIVVDTNFHYSSQNLVLELLHYGLEPDTIKYIIVTHAHDDRYWGAKALQDTYPEARVAMSGADWDVVAEDNSPAELKPRRDMVITDGQQITLGDVTVTLYVTPGHTPGTLSMIIEPLTNQKSISSDDGRHVAAIWGGVDASIGRRGVRYYPDGEAMMSAHVESIRRFMDLATKAGVDVILPTSVSHANIPEKMRALRMMNPDMSGNNQGDVDVFQAEVLKYDGETHPFVSTEAAERYHTILLECYQAQLAWRMGS